MSDNDDLQYDVGEIHHIGDKYIICGHVQCASVRYPFCKLCRGQPIFLNLKTNTKTHICGRVQKVDGTLIKRYSDFKKPERTNIRWK